jgi:hypothetical protein
VTVEIAAVVDVAAGVTATAENAAQPTVRPLIGVKLVAKRRASRIPSLPPLGTQPTPPKSAKVPPEPTATAAGVVAVDVVGDVAP